MEYDWLKNAHCFPCEGNTEEEYKNTPVERDKAIASLKESGLVRCEKHLKEWRKNDRNNK